jgi:phosphoglycerate kinase
MKTIDDINVKGKRVLVRTDLNVPMKDGKILDNTRLLWATKTISQLSVLGAKVIVMSHFGRPNGADLEMSLQPLAEALRQTLPGYRIKFVEDCIGPKAIEAVNEMKNMEILLLENLRFHAGEEANDSDFARGLSELGDFYVNDAFSVAHRSHASTVGIPRFLPSVIGRVMKREIDTLTEMFRNHKKSITAVVGGAKVSTKLELLKNLVSRVDQLIIGGAMANTFIYANGGSIGSSLCEKDLAELAREIMKEATEKGCKILLPIDGIIASSFNSDELDIVASHKIPEDKMMLDIGPDTIELFREHIMSSQTIIWNGPLGMFEEPPFDVGTSSVARTIAMMTQTKGTMSVAGGGDTIAAISKIGIINELTHVSLAGGAFLQWLEGKPLPALSAL